MPRSNRIQQVLANKGAAIDEAEIESPTAGSTEEDPVTGSSRIDRIRLAAYLAAERRGFEPGYEESDWLEAERNVDAQRQEAGGDGGSDEAGPTSA